MYHNSQKALMQRSRRRGSGQEAGRLLGTLFFSSKWTQAGDRVTELGYHLLPRHVFNPLYPKSHIRQALL